ncbi:MAG: phosphopyruvate hydratase [Planctomycetota bacterium]
MPSDRRIASVEALEVLDSRGNPTVEVVVTLVGGAQGRALVPSGASTGAHEALELRDRDARYGGRGVRRAVANAQGPLAAAVTGLDAGDTPAVDAAMRAADGAPNLGTLGANAVLGISLAAARAAAAASRVPLWQHVGALAGEGAPRLPVPLLNVLNGGVHADNGLDVQEFMIAPLGFPSFAEGLRAGVETYHALKKLLVERGLGIAVGDEGGFAPRVKDNDEALACVAEAIERAGYEPGRQVALALDVAATELVVEGGYRFEGQVVSADALIERYARWAARFPIHSIEDGLGEDDWEGWRRLTDALGARMQLVGDDLFVTDPARLARGIGAGVANAVLVKPNQIGTLADTLTCVRDAHRAGYASVMSHRSGETEDDTIADLAVALGTGQIKTGAPCRGERTAKYNRLLRIEADASARGSALPYGLRPRGA